MSLKEILGLTGQLVVTLMGPDGKVKDRRDIKNLVVNAGLGFITARMIGTSLGVMSHMALGSGAVAAAADNTDLGALLGSRKVLDSATRAGASNQSVVYVATFQAGEGTGAVTEAGIFNGLTAGTMLCRTVFPVVNKQAADTLQITWTITLAAA